MEMSLIVKQKKKPIITKNTDLFAVHQLVNTPIGTEPDPVSTEPDPV